MPNVIKRKNDPYIYLHVMGEWYCYNPVERPLGGGAMGDVYLGYRLKDNALIAVKCVKNHYANNRQIRERAQQEASLAFRHPNLIEMIGYCESAPYEGPIYLLSYYVQGENIDKYVARLGDTPDRVHKICIAMCAILDALDYVHSRGVVHRDIKPSNIMVENDGENYRLMDLGIARMNGGNKFSTIGFIGTPEYAAPEQILREQNGIQVQINATTDIYALGITFYELLTGVNPMAGGKDAETLQRQMRQPLPSNPNIPSKLMRVLWKSTEKEQSHRYQTALEFKTAIQNALLPDPPFSQVIVEWIRSHIGILLVVLAIIVVVSFLTAIV